MVIGPRIWKTGIAVALCIFLAEAFNLISPMLAIVAAILTIQPSIAKSINQGGNRVVATFIGGFLGYLVVSNFGAHPITVGLTVIIAIAISTKLKLQEGTVITAITVAAIMVDVAGDAKIYALYRLVETLLGIGVGVTVNMIFSPPNTEKNLIDGLIGVNLSLKNFYMAVLNGFIMNEPYDREKIEKILEGIRTDLEEIRKRMFEYKEEIGYRKTMKSKKVRKYEFLVTNYNMIFERILSIYYTELSRSERKINREGDSLEFKNIVATMQKLVTTTMSIQENIVCYLTSKNPDLCTYLENCGQQGYELVTEMRNQINHWHLMEENKNKVLSLLEISSIGYEMGQINGHLHRITKRLKAENQTEENGDGEDFVTRLVGWFRRK